VDLSAAEVELVRLWRSTDGRGHEHIMDVARFEVEAAAEARSVLWHVVEGGCGTGCGTHRGTGEHRPYQLIRGRRGTA